MNITLFDMVRFWLTAKALHLAIALMPKHPVTQVAIRQIRAACASLVDALEDE